MMNFPSLWKSNWFHWAGLICLNHSSMLADLHQEDHITYCARWWIGPISNGYEHSETFECAAIAEVILV
jgi:hypothetical protein